MKDWSPLERLNTLTKNITGDVIESMERFSERDHGVIYRDKQRQIILAEIAMAALALSEALKDVSFGHGQGCEGGLLCDCSIGKMRQLQRNLNKAIDDGLGNY